jgi:hypothetical protein
LGNIDGSDHRGRGRSDWRQAETTRLKILSNKYRIADILSA